MLGLEQSRAGVGGDGDLMGTLGGLGAGIGLVVTRPVARGAKRLVELPLGDLDLGPVLLDLVDEDLAHLGDLFLAPRGLVVLDP